MLESLKTRRTPAIKASWQYELLQEKRKIVKIGTLETIFTNSLYTSDRQVYSSEPIMKRNFKTLEKERVHMLQSYQDYIALSQGGVFHYIDQQ